LESAPASAQTRIGAHEETCDDLRDRFGLPVLFAFGSFAIELRASNNSRNERATHDERHPSLRSREAGGQFQTDGFNLAELPPDFVEIKWNRAGNCHSDLSMRDNGDMHHGRSIRFVGGHEVHRQSSWPMGDSSIQPHDRRSSRLGCFRVRA